MTTKVTATPKNILKTRSASTIVPLQNHVSRKAENRNRRHQAEDAQLMLVSQEILRLVEASREGRLTERGRPEQFSGAHREILRGVNEMLDAILLPIGEGNRIMAQISSGRIDELIAQTYKGDHEKMKQAVNSIAVVLQALQKEMGRLTEAAGAGRLTQRGRVEQYGGAYAEIVVGVNAILDAVVTPLNVAACYIDQISKGDLPPQITTAYHGDFNR